MEKPLHVRLRRCGHFKELSFPLKRPIRNFVREFLIIVKVAFESLGQKLCVAFKEMEKRSGVKELLILIDFMWSKRKMPAGGSETERDVKCIYKVK